jgi:TPR repeat protein
MGQSLNSIAGRRLMSASSGDAQSLYEMGIAYWIGAEGHAIDLIEAHKWFNLAALNGSEPAQECRAEIADCLTAREIADAQRQARAWLCETTRQAA